MRNRFPVDGTIRAVLDVNSVEPSPATDQTFPEYFVSALHCSTTNSEIFSFQVKRFVGMRINATSLLNSLEKV